MDKEHKSALVDAWIRLQTQPPGSDSANAMMWASIELDLLGIDTPDECWEIVLEILDRTDDRWILGNLAAGPVESLLAQHGDLVVSWVEKRALEDRRFRELLRSVWRNLISDHVWERIHRTP